MSNVSPFDTDIGGTGTRLQPGIGKAYPELKRKMQEFFAARVAKLPWLPDNWLPAVQAIQRDNPDDVVMIARKNWGDSDAWNMLADDSRDIQKAYAAGKAAEGRDILAAVDRNATFWNAAYKVALVAAAPVRAVEIVNEKAKYVVILIGLGVALYFAYPFLIARAVRK